MDSRDRVVYAVARNYAKPGKGGGNVFSTQTMPDGTVVRILDRAVHEEALAAAGRKLRELMQAR